MLVFIIMCTHKYTHMHTPFKHTYMYKESDLDSECILSGESSVRELVSLYNPGVTKDLKSITMMMISKCNTNPNSDIQNKQNNIDNI